MKYPVEMGVGAMIYTSSFIKVGLCVQTLLGEILLQAHKHTQTAR
jgi:hypothetical protein